MILATGFLDVLAGLAVALGVAAALALLGFVGWEWRVRIATEEKVRAALADLDKPLLTIARFIEADRSPASSAASVEAGALPRSSKSRKALVEAMIEASQIVAAPEASREGSPSVAPDDRRAALVSAFADFDDAKRRLDELPTTSIEWVLADARIRDLDVGLIADLFDVRDELGASNYASDVDTQTKLSADRQERLRQSARRFHTRPGPGD
jgi:hypothetical protein